MPEFKSFAVMLAERRNGVQTEPNVVTVPALDARLDDDLHGRDDAAQSYAAPHRNENAEIARDVRLFRAFLREELEAAVESLRAKVAEAILFRELQLSDADISRTIDAALDTYACETPLHIRVHREDAGKLAHLPFNLCVDDSLKQGEAIIALPSGEIDLRFATRLQYLLNDA